MMTADLIEKHQLKFNDESSKELSRIVRTKSERKKNQARGQTVRIRKREM